MENTGQRDDVLLLSDLIGRASGARHGCLSVARFAQGYASGTPLPSTTRDQIGDWASR
jgi:hypothetical protein